MTDNEWTAEESHHDATTAAHDHGTQIVRMSDVAPERVAWLWPGRIPFGKLTVLDGDPKLGKSVAMPRLGHVPGPPEHGTRRQRHGR
jgi:hypothetical protein